MSYFEITTSHRGKIRVSVGGLAAEIPEHRNNGDSSSSQIASAKLLRDEPIIMFQTYDPTLKPINAALKQAVETVIYSRSETPVDGVQAGLAIWGITLITYAE